MRNFCTRESFRFVLEIGDNVITFWRNFVSKIVTPNYIVTVKHIFVTVSWDSWKRRNDRWMSRFCGRKLTAADINCVLTMLGERLTLGYWTK